MSINDETVRVLQWAKKEHGLAYGDVIRIGVMFLDMMSRATEISLIDRDGNVEYIDRINPQAPGPEYDL